jgi:predicted phage baseplate assembly protein
MSSTRWGDLVVAGDARRRLLLERHDNGLDGVEVREGGRRLLVYFFQHAPRGLHPGNIRIDAPRGGRPVRAVEVRRAEELSPEVEDCLIVELDHAGSGGPYLLRIVAREPDDAPGWRPYRGVDPRYAQVRFVFDVDAPRPPIQRAPAGGPAAYEAVSYLNRDYAGLRQLMLNRLAVTMPGWTEQHEPDIWITLVELLAYIGDDLSYYEDAVATEAYLQTARNRISVRRHGRLVGYRVHEGCNARAWVCVHVNSPVSLPLNHIRFAAAGAWVDGGSPVLDARTFPPETLASVQQYSPVSVQPGAQQLQSEVTLLPAHNSIGLWSWGEHDSHLAAGATSAVLIDGAPPKSKGQASQRALELHAGDVLVLEETKDPQTHGQGPADPSLRQAVRLTGVQRIFDPLYKQPLLQVQWAPEDALGFDLAVTSDNNQCAQASGNVVLVANGVATTETIPVSSPVLSHSGISYATPFPDPKTVGHHQARRLRSLYHNWREQVEAWRWQADGGTPLSAEQLNTLRLQIGIEELERLGLSGERRKGPEDARAELAADALAELLARTELAADALAELLAESKGDPLAALLARTNMEADALAELVARTNLEADALAELLTRAWLEADALAELLARADRLLAGRRRRLEFLARLAEGTGPLNDVLIEELTEDWGEALTAALPPGQPGSWGPASTAITQDPRAALPVLELADGTGDTWSPALDLIGVAPTHQVFVAEVNDQGIAQLRINNPPPATLTLPTSADTRAGSGSTLPFVSSTGVTKGVAVSGFNIADGTTVSDVTSTSVVLSQPVTGDVPKGSSITFAVTLSASYWIGNGTAGNAEIEAINALVWSPSAAAATGSSGGTVELSPPSGISGIRNPLAITGGIDAETTAAAKLAIPGARAVGQQRALTVNDYNTLAAAVPGVRRSAAELRFTGSLAVVDVAIQPERGEDPAAELLAYVRRSLERVRKIGELVRVLPPRYRPLVVALDITLAPDTIRRDVAHHLERLLSSGWLPDGTPGLFNPAKLAFATPVYVSPIIAAVQRVNGVDSVTLRRFGFLDEPAVGSTSSELPLGTLEIARLDNDPTQPEHGYAVVSLRGGR